jgi:hypothetical protein
MAVRAHIRENMPLMGVEVLLFDKSGDSGPALVWAPGSSERHLSRLDTVPDVEPLHLRDDEARALLAALQQHYSGAEDTRALRRDYDAERKRVDLLIDKLANPVIATRGIEVRS